MSDTGATVEVGGLQITSNAESADEMVKALTPPDKEAEKIPRVVEGEEKSPLSDAAAKLGAEGGKAAAKARQIKPIPLKPRETPSYGKLETLSTGGKGSEPSSEETPGTDEDLEKPLGKPRDDPRARMLEATRKEAEAKRRASEAEARAAQLEAYVQGLEANRQPKEEGAPRQDPNAPPFKWEDFDTPEEYVAAYYNWQTQRQAIAQQEQAAVNAYREQLDQALSAFNERCAEVDVSKIAPEIRELQCSAALEPNEQVGPENVIADEIIASENGPGLMLYLTEHPDDFQRLMTLPSPQHIAREFMRLEAKVEAASAGTPVSPKAISKARPPIRPVTGPLHTADPYEVSDEMDTTEWIKRRQAQEMARRAKR